MICKAGILWDTPQIFHRFVQDCGITCEVITPHFLAAPFFRGSYVALIVPTGFANRKYSVLLPVLRAKKDRIESFLERGGRLLVFGAAEVKADAYDWLPFDVRYSHGYQERKVSLSTDSSVCSLLEGYDCSTIPCDGTFCSDQGKIEGSTDKGEAILLTHRVGEGIAVITSVHEYPSRKFLREFCCGENEVAF
ncbi:MAG: hypothetical protein LUQ17_04665 [Methanomicrobiales archaeon]|nr:hypothetical protein [Methanomicrobiales archaeon]